MKNNNIVTKKLDHISNDVLNVINRMNYIQSVINTFEGFDDLMSIENALRAASVELPYMLNSIMLLYDELEDYNNEE